MSSRNCSAANDALVATNRVGVVPGVNMLFQSSSRKVAILTQWAIERRRSAKRYCRNKARLLMFSPLNKQSPNDRHVWKAARQLGQKNVAPDAGGPCGFGCLLSLSQTCVRHQHSPLSETYHTEGISHAAFLLFQNL